MPESEDEIQKRIDSICEGSLEFVVPPLTEERVREIAREATLRILAQRDEQSRKFWEAANESLLKNPPYKDVQATVDAILAELRAR